MTEIDEDLKTGNIFGLSEVFFKRNFSVLQEEDFKNEDLMVDFEYMSG